MERVHIVIDESSTMDSFKDSSIRNVVVFIHGIFGDSRETWGATPTQMATSPLFTSFDYASFGYGSRLIEFRQPDVIVDQLILWIRTNLADYDNIFFIAHSMGGLLVRQALTKMLRSANDRSLVKKIRRCFMIAAPVTGSWAARCLGRIPLLRRINSKIAYLAAPTIDGKDMSAAYKDASAAFVSAGESVTDIPRFSYFVGDRDFWVMPAAQIFYTDYDEPEGPVTGTHATLKEDLNANSVLIRRITQLLQDAVLRSQASQRDRILMVKEATRKREVATQSRRTENVAPASGDAVDVVLISCSATKTDGNGRVHPKAGGISEVVADPRVGQLVIETRSRVLRLMQEGKIDGIEFAQGNRASMPVNRGLTFGPDFGGAINDTKYLPAFARYKGRCYQASEAEWSAMIQAPRHPYFLIMSGLYGLIPPTEHIQNYDVHLTDVDLSNGISIQTYWKDRELMTQVLISHLEWIEANVGPVRLIVDALSELSYQETINWSLVDRRWSVLHRVFERTAGRDCLGNLGLWLQDAIRHPVVLQEVRPDEFYENPRFHPADRIAFERYIGGSHLPVAREINQ